jgi:hypothetical protein
MNDLIRTDQCLNCGATLAGPWCHACGQPVKGMIRHLRSILRDFLDTVFEYDSRIWRSLVPLYFAPGRITLDYLAGRRARYVMPFRLFFVLTVLAFLALQLTVAPDQTSELFAKRLTDLPATATSDEVIQARERALDGIEQSRADLDGPAAERVGLALDRARETVERTAQERLDWIAAAEAAREAGLKPPPGPRTGPSIRFDTDGDPWDPATNPLTASWLPAFAEARVNQWISRALRNVERVDEEPERYLNAFMSLLPAVLFVLMPIFALLLKGFHLFTGRLYMEHMIVALHSHSFLALALILAVVLGSIKGTLPDGSVVRAAVGFALAASLVWIPAYMLIMQRRVYRQRWSLTLIKFFGLGTIYLLLVIAAVVVAVVVTLVRA